MAELGMIKIDANKVVSNCVVVKVVLTNMWLVKVKRVIAQSLLWVLTKTTGFKVEVHIINEKKD